MGSLKQGPAKMKLVKILPLLAPGLSGEEIPSNEEILSSAKISGIPSLNCGDLFEFLLTQTEYFQLHDYEHYPLRNYNLQYKDAQDPVLPENIDIGERCNKRNCDSVTAVCNKAKKRKYIDPETGNKVHHHPDADDVLAYNEYKKGLQARATPDEQKSTFRCNLVTHKWEQISGENMLPDCPEVDDWD